jgi:predicted glycosyltransferase
MTLKVWLDIDNPPQARYLLPLAKRFKTAQCDVLLTARSSENTLALLDSEGVDYHPIGTSFGKGIRRKLYGVAARRNQLLQFLADRREKVDLVVTGSRSATLAARRLGIPSFVIVDYEHTSLFVYKLARSHVLHPEVIPAQRFMRHGIGPHRLLAFEGFKEDLTFADTEFESVVPWAFPPQSDLPRILVRPPAEESYYYRSESLKFLMAVLRYLARQDVQVLYSPRYDHQVRYLRDVGGWRHDPAILSDPVPVVALLKGVDAVVSAGGTMVREAAYLGIPAYSIFRGRPGAVDEHLASVGRMTLLTFPLDVRSLRLCKRPTIDPIRHDSRTIDEVVKTILTRVTSGANGVYRSPSVGHEHGK